MFMSISTSIPFRIHVSFLSLSLCLSQARPWKFKPAAGGPAIAVSRTQLTVLPKKQGTLHGVQGKTADPGFIVHWAFPPGLKKESMWLAYYVSLSRPRSFAQLLSHVLPDRSINGDFPDEPMGNSQSRHWGIPRVGIGEFPE